MRALILLALVTFLGVSTLFAAAPITTLEQEMAILEPLLAKAQSDPAAMAASLPSLVPQYGYWCGPQKTDPFASVVDCVDEACRQHDLSTGYSSPLPTLADVGKADQQFIWNLSNTVASTPYGELYRTTAIEVFQLKVTYEQANKVTLYTACKDCADLLGK